RGGEGGRGGGGGRRGVEGGVEGVGGQVVEGDDRAGGDCQRLADGHGRATDLDRRLDENVEDEGEIAGQRLLRRGAELLQRRSDRCGHVDVCHLVSLVTALPGR